MIQTLNPSFLSGFIGLFIWRSNKLTQLPFVLNPQGA